MLWIRETKMLYVIYSAHTKGISQQVSRYIRMTSDLYHAALNYVINVCVSHWDEICGLDTLDAKTYVESLIHSTKTEKCALPFVRQTIS